MLCKYIKDVYQMNIQARQYHIQINLTAIYTEEGDKETCYVYCTRCNFVFIPVFCVVVCINCFFFQISNYLK